MQSFHQFLEERDVDALAKKYKVPEDQLRMGIKVEKEHDGPMGKDVDVVSSKEDIVKIAVAHLREDPKYYTKLKEVED